jgi:hypothetical protein
MAGKTWFIASTSRGFGREWAVAALDRGLFLGGAPPSGWVYRRRCSQPESVQFG